MSRQKTENRASAADAQPEAIAAEPGAIEAGTPAPTLDALSQVRDLLFGEQERATDQRFQILEDRLNQALQSLQAQLSEQLTSLKAELDATFAQHAEQLQSLESGLREEREETARQLEAARTELADQIRAASDTLTEQLADERAARERVDEAAANLAESKVDRTTLAALFAEMASRVG
jgi:hypothetical protein